MDEGLRQQAMEWFERGGHDLEAAQLLLDHQGPTDVIACSIQQGIEKCLKGYLVRHGQKPPRTHDLGALLSRVSRLRSDVYDPFVDLCEKATHHYVDGRYPPGPPPQHDAHQMREDLALAQRLAGLLQQDAGD